MTYSESIGNISEIYRIQKEKLELLNKFFLENLWDKVTVLEDWWEISFRDLLDIIRQSYDEYTLLLGRVESILTSPKEWKISKTAIEVIKEQVIEISNFPESLRNEYLWTLDLWKEQFPEINYDEVHLKVNEYRWLLITVSEFSDEIKNLLKMRISEKDGYYIFNDKENTDEWKIEEWIVIESKLDEEIIQISEYLQYSKTNNLFIDIKSGKEYRHNSDDFTLFMEIMLEEWRYGSYVNMINITTKMKIPRYEEWWGFVKKVPTTSSAKVRTTYINLKKALRREFEYKNNEEDICWPCKGGFRIPFFRK